MSKTRFAVWRRMNRLYVVRPPGWPKDTELSFTDKDDMRRWAEAAHVMLKDGNSTRAAAR